MKILYHHRTAAADGQLVHIQELTSALERSGQEVVFVGPGGERHRHGAMGRLPPGQLRKLVPPVLSELVEMAYSVIAFVRGWRICRRFKPDVIYERANLFFFAGVWLARYYRVPLLLEVNAPLARERAEHGRLFYHRLAAWSERWVWRNADHIFAVSGVLARDIAAASVDPYKITVTHNGVGAPFLNPPVPDEGMRLGWGAGGRLILGFVGFIRRWHKLEPVLDFIATEGDRLALHLVIVGDGPAKGALESRVRALGIDRRVTFTGVVQRAEIPGVISCFDIALQPSAVTYASPLKLFEYMALGKAVVAPATANICEVAEDGRTALLFEPDNWAAFAQTLRRACEDKTLRIEIGKTARRHIVENRYTWDKNAEVVCAVAQKLVASRV